MGQAALWEGWGVWVRAVREAARNPAHSFHDGCVGTGCTGSGVDDLVDVGGGVEEVGQVEGSYPCTPGTMQGRQLGSWAGGPMKGIEADEGNRGR